MVCARIAGFVHLARRTLDIRVLGVGSMLDMSGASPLDMNPKQGSLLLDLDCIRKLAFWSTSGTLNFFAVSFWWPRNNKGGVPRTIASHR